MNYKDTDILEFGLTAIEYCFVNMLRNYTKGASIPPITNVQKIRDIRHKAYALLQFCDENSDNGAWQNVRFLFCVRVACILSETPQSEQTTIKDAYVSLTELGQKKFTAFYKERTNVNYKDAYRDKLDYTSVVSTLQDLAFDLDFDLQTACGQRD